MRMSSLVLATGALLLASPVAAQASRPDLAALAAQVRESGTLAISSGPVRDPSGKRTGTFNSIWRLESPGVWKIIFDKGCPRIACDCAK